MPMCAVYWRFKMAPLHSDRNEDGVRNLLKKRGKKRALEVREETFLAFQLIRNT